MASPTTDRRLGLAGNTAIKAPVDCATTSNITLSGEQTIDGVTTSASRVLVKNQTDATTNGLYDSSSAAWTRCVDANGNYDLVRGALVLVAGGSTQSGVIYQCTATTNPITIGTSSITWSVSLTASLNTLSFTQSGANSVARTAQSKLREWLSAYDTGAVGDGSANDITALSSLVTDHPYALFNGGSGTFKITTNLPAGWRMLEGKILDTRMVTAQDDYSVLALGWSVLQANTYIPEQWAASGGRFFASGNHIVALGGEALKANTTGRRNTAVGSRTQPQITTGYYNTAIGSHSMEGGSTAYENTFAGVQTGQSLTTGYGNTGVGLTALGRISVGFYNTAIGWGAGSVNTTLANINGGSYNFWGGYRTGYVNETGQDNTAVSGRDALVSLTTGNNNFAGGSLTLQNVVSGSNNVGVGYNVASLYTGSDLTAGGRQAFAALVSGIQCTAWGNQAGNAATGNNGTFVGYRSGYIVSSGTGHTHLGSTTGATITTGSNCTMLGYATDGTAGGDNQTSVGYLATCTGANQVTLGNSSVAALRCQMALTVLSDMRDKVRVGDLPGLSFVERIEPFLGRWDKRDGSNPPGTFAFFSAQNLQAAQAAAGIDLGLVSDLDPERLEVTTERLLPVLVQAIMDLSAESDALRARVAALEAA